MPGLEARGVRIFSVLALLIGAASALPCRGQVVRQITDVKTAVAGPGAMDDVGSAVFAGSSADPAAGNPGHAFEIFRFDPATGAATQVTTAPRGVSPLVSVSDDGSWIAFPSPADLTGQNHDQSVELFVMSSSGSQITQLTNEPAPNAGGVSSVAMAGGGSRIAFLAGTNPLGTNPLYVDQLFVINRDGNGLRQLTAVASGSIGGVSISDDGSRIAFSHDGDLVPGGNPDLGSEIFVVNADGTGLRQLTSTAATYGSSAPSLSGNGVRIAFQSNGDLVGTNTIHQDEVFVVNWDGTGLRQLTRTTSVLTLFGAPGAQSPAITDDGLTVFFQSTYGKLFLPVNLDGNYEIFKIRADGTGLTVLTNTLLSLGCFFPTVSGNGGRVTYYGIGTSATLEVMDGSGGAKRTLLTFDLIFNQAPAITPDGTRAVFVKATGLLSSSQLWRVETDGTSLSQVTSLSSGTPASPSVAADRETIVFSADSDPTGGNSDTSEEIFTVRADGSGIRQLTFGASGTNSQNPVVAAGSGVVVFDSNADLTGGNVDASREIFKVNLDGTGLAQLTSGLVSTTSDLPRVDASGTWVVFESNADLDGGNPDGTTEIFRIRTDGGGLQRITGSATLDSRLPDIDGAGDRIAFNSAADPLGTNPELNGEVFVFEPATLVLRQLTFTTEGTSGGARITGDGAWVYFASDAPIFETDPSHPSDLYRVPAAGGTIERIGGLRAGVPSSALGAVGGAAAGMTGGGGGVVVDGSGAVSAFSGMGDFTGQNRDILPEIWVADRRTVPGLEVGKAAPTVLSWSVESGPLRYDAIRGAVSSLRSGPGGTADLGAVICLENDSPDTTTAGYGDASDPLPGQAFFFLYRGSQGFLGGPGSYGSSSVGAERTPGTGDCAR